MPKRKGSMVKMLQILGAGCPRCEMLANNVEAAAKSLDLDCRIEKIADVNRITSMGVLITPAFAIDGEVRVAGKIPSVEEIRDMIEDEGVEAE